MRGVTTMTSDVASPRPALTVLQAQQKELIDHEHRPMTGLDGSLRRGFDSRASLLVWYQAAVVRTFGALAETIPPHNFANDRTLLQAAIVDDDRRAQFATDDPMSLTGAARYRRSIEQYALLPATNEAYNQLRKMAGEYVGKDTEDIPEELSHDKQEIAMRPAFSRKDLEQREALERLWAGFATEDDIRDWLHDLDQPTNGALEADFARRIMTDRVAVRHLVRGQVREQQARIWREWLAITHLLPAFVTGVRRMDAGELAKRTREGLEVAQG